ncbi:MAG: WD40 repeat domain-containing protein [Planctomycetes bacterium]|nr:WD40 repeat domain-containing protein [Planctomycetota bacterium]
MALTLYSGNGRFYLWGAADRDASQLLIAKPEGWGLYLGGAGAAMLSFIGHLARRCEGKLKLLVLLLMGGTLLSIRAHAFFWDAWGRVGWSPNRGCLSPPAPDAPSWVGSILITFTAFLLCLLLPLAVRGLRSFSKVIPAGLAAINVLLLSSLAWASREMPLTSPSEMKHLAFTYDPEYFVTAHEGETFRLWRIDAGADSRLVRKYRFSRGPFRTTTMTLSPGFAAASTEDGRITLWHLPSFRQVLEIDTFGAPVRTLAISPAGGSRGPRIEIPQYPGYFLRRNSACLCLDLPEHRAHGFETKDDTDLQDRRRTPRCFLAERASAARRRRQLDSSP